MRPFLLAASAAAALFAAAPALADITVISSAPYPGNPPENVLLTSQTSGTTIFGTTNQTSSTVRFTSVTDSLVASPNGQATLTATDGTLGNLDITLNNGLGFTSFEFNINSPTTQQISLIFTDQFGTTQAQNTVVPTSPTTFTVGANGVNRFNAVASNGQIITKVSLTGVGLTDVRQVRLGGVTAVPEPGTWALMIAGFGGAGAVLRRRRSAMIAA